MTPKALSHANDFLPEYANRSTENRILRIVFNTDLRCGHDGLEKIAKNLKVNVHDLEIGTFVVFVNRKKSALKMYAAGNTIAHFRMPGARQFNVKILGMIPRFFNGKELRYDDALAELIKKEIRH